MSDQYLHLLARTYIAQRLGHLGTGLLPIHHEIRDTLDATGRLPRRADNCTDSEIREAFGVRTALQVQPANSVERTPVSPAFTDIEPSVSDDDTAAFSDQLTNKPKRKGSK